MPDLIPFHYNGNPLTVRTDEHGDPWFLGAPAADILGYANPHQALARLDDDEKGRYKVPTPGGEQQAIFINESGLYTLIVRSRKAEAKAFRRWVTHEVLPTIRKTGTYTAPTATHPTPPPPIDTRRAELDYLQAHHDFLDQLGMLDAADKLLLADKARTLLISSGGGAVLLTAPASPPAVHGYFVAERVQALGYCLTRKQEMALIGSLSKQIVSEYRSRYGAEPLKRQRYIDGAVRPVNWYPVEETDWMDPIIQGYMATFPGIVRQPS